jgi:hypothetical protein
MAFDGEAFVERFEASFGNDPWGTRAAGKAAAERSYRKSTL